MSNTSNEILNLEALSAVGGGKGYPGFISDPAFQDDVERLIRQWQFSEEIDGRNIDNYGSSHGYG